MKPLTQHAPDKALPAQYSTAGSQDTYKHDRKSTFLDITHPNECIDVSIY